MQKNKESDWIMRAHHIHCARVYLAEARRRRKQSFGFVLLQWAANARRQAMEVSPAPKQPDLFEGGI